MVKRNELDKYKEQIINLYLNEHLSCNKISQIVGCSLCGVYDALKRWNVKTRNLSQSHKQYKVNENYFDCIDSEDKAYWLGFIYADGYITGNNLGISLASVDKGHLNKFLRDTESDYPINTYISKSKFGECKYCRVILKSQKIVSDIKQKGVFENKSLKLKFPTNEMINKDLVGHFIRGYFDGDGSLILSKNSINFKFCGTSEFLTELINRFNRVSAYEFKHKLFKRHHDDKNNYYISYGGRFKTLSIMDYLYNDAQVYLDRKYEKYINLKTMQ